MKTTIELNAQLEEYKNSTTIENHQKLIKLSDYLLKEVKEDLRQGKWYDLALSVILELMSLRIGIASFKKYDDQDLDLEIIIRQMKLLKRVVPDDEKMQKIITRIFRG